MAIILYAPVTSLFWTFDDPFNIRYVAHYSPLQYSFDSGIWRELPFRMFTPLMFASFDADLAMFDISPFGFYVHHLVSLMLAAIAVFTATRLWLDHAEAFAVAAMFLLAVPTVSWAQQLMVRHYIEGLLCAALALFAFVMAVRRERAGWAVIAAFLSLIAMLAKEVYVPLPLLFLTVREGDRSARLKYVSPSLVALGVYLVWRMKMLGTLGGGYGWAVERKDVPRLLAELPEKIGVALSGGSLAGWLVLIVVFAGFVWMAARAPALIVLLILALAPILPVSTVMERRYTVLLWVLFAAAFVYASQLAMEVRARRWMIALLLVALLIANRAEWRGAQARMRRMSDEAELYLRLPERDRIRKPLSPPATMAELAKLKEETLRSGRAAGWYYDDFFLCNRSVEGRIWSVDSGGARDVTRETLAAAKSYCDGIRREAALEVATLYSEGSLFWELGPYREGRYAFLVGDGQIRYDMPAEAGFQIGRLPAISFRVKYESPTGWVTYSPELTMTLEDGARLEWSRKR